MSGGFVLSLDLELAWGSLDRADLGPIRDAGRYVAEQGAERLIRALEERGLAATWATVGAMLGSGWDRSVALDEAPDPRWEAPALEAVAGDPSFFAPHLGERLVGSRHQELGFHGFTHLAFDDSRMTAARARDEVAACQAVADRLGVRGVSWVFPRNRIAHLDALESGGFRVYRGLDRKRARVLGARAGRRRGLAEALVTDWLGLPAPSVAPRRRGGLVEVPGSTLLAFGVGLRRGIPDPWRRATWRRGLERAARTGRLFHAWLHPVNLWPDPEPRLALLERFLDDVAEARDAGRIRVWTLGGLAGAEGPAEGGLQRVSESQ